MDRYNRVNQVASRYQKNIQESNQKYRSSSGYNAGDPYNHKYDDEKVSRRIYMGLSKG